MLRDTYKNPEVQNSLLFHVIDLQKTSEGARKAWETRRHGGSHKAELKLSKKERWELSEQQRVTQTQIEAEKKKPENMTWIEYFNHRTARPKGEVAGGTTYYAGDVNRIRKDYKKLQEKKAKADQLKLFPEKKPEKSEKQKQIDAMSPEDRKKFMAPWGGNVGTGSKSAGQMVKDSWSEKLQGIPYERASELEGHDTPRMSAAYFHFDELTPQEQENTIQTYKNELEEAKRRQKDVLKETGKTYAEIRGRREKGISLGGDKSMLAPLSSSRRREAKRDIDRNESIIANLSSRMKKTSELEVYPPGYKPESINEWMEWYDKHKDELLKKRERLPGGKSTKEIEKSKSIKDVEKTIRRVEKEEKDRKKLLTAKVVPESPIKQMTGSGSY